MERFEYSEIISLVLAGPLFLATLLLFRRMLAGYAMFFLAAATFALGATVFTVLEDLALRASFNVLEHLCYAMTGITLGIGCYMASKPDGDTSPEAQ